ncbi:ClbS/DfsB family four-helix bundle protein, partial [Aliarcobacter butzleri]
MAVPTNKEELLIAINTNYIKLKKELNNIPIEKTN